MKKVMGLALLMMAAGAATTCFSDVFDDGKRAYEKKSYIEASEAFKKVCDGGNAKGCYMLGSMYENGEGVAQNKYQASTLYAQACRSKEALGCSSMSLTYDTP